MMAMRKRETSGRNKTTACCSKVGLKRGPWTAEEDEVLAKYIAEEGEGRWRTLPKRAGLLRYGKSCRLRWMNYLRPSVKRGHIAPDEEDLILRLHRLLGNRWSLIAGRIPGRTDNEIKNYWNTHLSKKLISQGIDPRTHKPLASSSSSPPPSARNIFIKPPSSSQTDPIINAPSNPNPSSNPNGPVRDAFRSGFFDNDNENENEHHHPCSFPCPQDDHGSEDINNCCSDGVFSDAFAAQHPHHPNANIAVPPLNNLVSMNDSTPAAAYALPTITTTTTWDSALLSSAPAFIHSVINDLQMQKLNADIKIQTLISQNLIRDLQIQNLLSDLQIQNLISDLQIQNLISDLQIQNHDDQIQNVNDLQSE